MVFSNEIYLDGLDIIVDKLNHGISLKDRKMNHFAESRWEIIKKPLLGSTVESADKPPPTRAAENNNEPLPMAKVDIWELKTSHKHGRKGNFKLDWK